MAARRCCGASWGVACTGVALGVGVPNVPSPGVCVLFVGGFGVDFFVSVLPGVEGGAVTGVAIERGGGCVCNGCG